MLCIDRIDYAKKDNNKEYIMPIKYDTPTSKQIDRQTKKVNIVHDYMKCKSNEDLIEAYKPVKPKLRQRSKRNCKKKQKPCKYSIQLV